MITFSQNSLLDLNDIIEDAVNEGIKKVVTTVQAEVVRNTPVSSGLLRANWQANKGVPAVGVLPIGSANSNAVRASIGLVYDVNFNYFLTNNVDYAYYVDLGSSRQSGQFFRQTGINQALRILR